MSNLQTIQDFSVKRDEQVYFGDSEFTWDPEASSKEIVFGLDNRHAFLYETNYYFRTIISNNPFYFGQKLRFHSSTFQLFEMFNILLILS